MEIYMNNIKLIKEDIVDKKSLPILNR